MHIHKVREIVNRRSSELQKEMQHTMETHKWTPTELTQNAPFLAGQAYALTMLMLELNALEMEEEERDQAKR